MRITGLKWTLNEWVVYLKHSTRRKEYKRASGLCQRHRDRHKKRNKLTPLVVSLQPVSLHRRDQSYADVWDRSWARTRCIRVAPFLSFYSLCMNNDWWTPEEKVCNVINAVYLPQDRIFPMQRFPELHFSAVGHFSWSPLYLWLYLMARNEFALFSLSFFSKWKHILVACILAILHFFYLFPPLSSRVRHALVVYVGPNSDVWRLVAAPGHRSSAERAHWHLDIPSIGSRALVVGVGKVVWAVIINKESVWIFFLTSVLSYMLTSNKKSCLYYKRG